MSISKFDTTAQEEADEKAEGVRQLVCFRLAEGSYALDIKFVREINRLTNVTTIPTAPDFVEGIINLRGSIIPVVNLGLRFGLAKTEHSKDARVVVIESNGRTLGMLVDEVSEVLRLSGAEIEPADNMVSSGIDVDFVDGVGKVGERLILLLAPDKLFTEEEQATLDKIAKG